MSQQKNVRHHLSPSAEPTQNRPPVCSQKVTLVADYGAAIAAYYVTVQELEQGMITGSAEVYAKQRKATEESREVCEAARKALDQHEAEHGC